MGREGIIGICLFLFLHAGSLLQPGIVGVQLAGQIGGVVPRIIVAETMPGNGIAHTVHGIHIAVIIILFLKAASDGCPDFGNLSGGQLYQGPGFHSRVGEQMAVFRGNAAALHAVGNLRVLVAVFRRRR